MGISRDWYHKRRLTGGKMPFIRKKRKFCLGRQPAMTKLGTKLVRPVRVRGGSIKQRALRLETGNFSWGSEAVSRKTRILGVVYNSTNNELVRTNTLVKGCIVQVDATPFRQFYMQHYGVELGKKKKAAAAGEEEEDEDEEDDGDTAAAGAAAAAEAQTAAPVDARSRTVLRKVQARAKAARIEKAVEDEFLSGRLYAKVSSRPGQCGRCDGYVLEGRELEFYSRALSKKKKSGK